MWNIRLKSPWNLAVWRSILCVAAIWFLGLGVTIGAAVLDIVGGLGWGYKTRDLWGGPLMAVGGLAILGFCRLLVGIVDDLTARRREFEEMDR